MLLLLDEEDDTDVVLLLFDGAHRNVSGQRGICGGGGGNGE